MALVFFGMLMPFLLPSQEQLNRYSSEAMGTNFGILIYGEKNLANQWSALAFEEIKRIEFIFSNYIDTSEVSKLNASKGWQQVSPEMAQLIAYSELINKYSDGAFDLKIGQIIDIWKAAIQQNKLPNSKLIRKLKRRSYWIDFKENQNGYWVKLGKHTKLDFGGIAKGYAVDKAFELLIENKMIYCLIDGGGDIRMGKSPPKSDGWKIKIYNETSEIHLLENCAIASSGHDYQFMQIGDNVFSHIINPKTSEAVVKKRGVTVLTSSCQLADALATSLYINPQAKALRENFQFKARIKEDDKYLVKDF